MSQALLAATGATDTAPEPGPALDTLRHIATRTAAPARGVTVTSPHGATCTDRIRHMITAPSTGIRLVYGCAAGITYTVSALLEVGAVDYPVTFAGAATATVSPGGYVTSDPIEVTLTAGQAIHTRTRVSTPLGSERGGSEGVVTVDLAQGDGHDHGDLTYVGAPAPTAGGGDVARHPLGIYAMTEATTTALAVGGDSIISGLNKWPVQWATRAGIAWTNASQSGEAVQHMPARRAARYGPSGLAAYTHYLCQYGINDSGSTTPDAFRATFVEHWAWCKASLGGPKRVIQATLLPWVSSTDGGVTLVNQTPANATNEASRLVWNAWFRDGAPLVAGAPAATGTTDPAAIRAGHADHPLWAVADAAALVESSLNSGKYRVDQGPIIGDGLHPAPGAHALIGTGLPTSLLT